MRHAGDRDAYGTFRESDTSDSPELMTSLSRSSCARGAIPRAPAAPLAAGGEQAAEDESSAAEAGTAAGCVVLESPRIEMLTMRGKVSSEWI